MSDDVSISNSDQKGFKRDILEVIKKILQDVIRESRISTEQLFYLYNQTLDNNRLSNKHLRILDDVLIKGFEQTDITGLSTLIRQLKIVKKSLNFQNHQKDIHVGVLHLTWIRNELEHTDELSISTFRKHINALTTLAAQFEIYLNKSQNTYRKGVEAIWAKAFDDIKQRIAAIVKGFSDMGLYCCEIRAKHNQFPSVRSIKSPLVDCREPTGTKIRDPEEKESMSFHEYSCIEPKIGSTYDIGSNNDERQIDEDNDHGLEHQPMMFKQDGPFPVQGHSVNLKRMQELSSGRKAKYRDKSCKGKLDISKRLGTLEEKPTIKGHKIQYPECPKTGDTLPIGFACHHSYMQNEVMTQCNTAWNIERTNNVATQEGSENINEATCSNWKVQRDILAFWDVNSTDSSQMFEDKMMYLSKCILGLKMDPFRAFSVPGKLQLAKRTEADYLIHVMLIAKEQEQTLEIRDIMEFMYQSKVNSGTGNYIPPALVVSEIPIHQLNHQIKLSTANLRQTYKTYDIMFVYCFEGKERAKRYQKLTQELLKPEITNLKLELYENVQMAGQRSLHPFVNASIQSRITIVVLSGAMAGSDELYKVHLMLMKLLKEGKYPPEHVALMLETGCRIPDFLLPLERFWEEDVVNKLQEKKEKLIKMWRDQT